MGRPANFLELGIQFPQRFPLFTASALCYQPP